MADQSGDRSGGGFSTKTYLLGFLVLLIILLSPILASLAFQNIPYVKFMRVQRAVHEELLRLTPKRPPEVAEKDWDSLVGSLVTAFANVAFSPSHASVERVQEFHARLSKLEEPSVGDLHDLWMFIEGKMVNSGTGTSRIPHSVVVEFKETLAKTLRKDGNR